MDYKRLAISLSLVINTALSSVGLAQSDVEITPEMLARSGLSEERLKDLLVNPDYEQLRNLVCIDKVIRGRGIASRASPNNQRTRTQIYNKLIEILKVTDDIREERRRLGLSNKEVMGDQFETPPTEGLSGAIRCPAGS